MSQTADPAEALFASTAALLDALWGSAPVGLGFWDRDLRYVRVNAALAAINERTPEDHVGRSLEEVVPQLAHELVPLARAVLETGEPVIGREIVAGTPNRPDDLRYWLASYYPVVDANGMRIGVGAVVEEITKRRRAEGRTEVQHAVTRVLVESDRVDEAVPRVLEAVGTMLGWDVGCYWPADPDEPRLVWSREGVRADGFIALTQRAALSPAMLPGRVLASRESVWLADLDPSQFARATLAAAEGLRSGVAVAVPLSDDRTGVLELFSQAHRQEDSDLVASLEAIAGQLGQFLRRRRAEEERTHLLHRERAARAEAEAAATTLRKLERVADAALQHSSLEDLLPALLERIVEVLEADTAAILLLEDDALLHVRATVGLEGELETAVAVPMGEGMAGRVAVSRAPLLVPDLSQIELVSPVLRERGVNSLVAIPLVVEDRVIGVVHAGSEAYAQFMEEDVRLLELIADRIALAVNQAALYEAERVADRRLRFLVEASALLASSLDVEKTLEQLASLIVGRVADWCAIHLVAEGGPARLVTIAHTDPEQERRARATLADSAPDPAAETGVGNVIRTGEPELYSEIPADLLGGAAAAAGIHSCLIAPLEARGRTFGAISLAWSETPQRYTEADLEFALDLARRAAVALDNAQLYGAAAERAQAARVLASVGDGVFLVDRAGYVRTWNRAAAVATGLPASQVVDRLALEAIPGWAAIASRVVSTAGGAARPESLPLDLGTRELWLSIHGVAVPDGVVYAFRDLTEERALEQLRTEFVSTVSHELRTPLAAIYGAAMTLRRSDVALDDDQRARLLEVVSGEADRLARTVNDILWASRLDTDSLHVAIESCDPLTLVHDVLAAQEAHLDAGHQLVLEADERLPLISGDPDKIGRVLINLVDNAVKYSPDGGRVAVQVRRGGSHVRFSVTDEGLGVPPSEQRRIFEKFYRLDPNMNRGVGGTGLGLYICRELVRRMDGRIWVESEGIGRGSTFLVELPAASY